MNADYKVTTSNFYLDPQSETLIELEDDVKISIMEAIEENIKKYLLELKNFLNEEKITSPEIYELKKKEIQEFIHNLITRQTKEIKQDLPHLEE